jgi:hypothetical protein
MNLIKAGLGYGAGAFGVGFVFGVLRELVLIPLLGDRIGHLTEFPFVTLGVMALGLWIGQRLEAPRLGRLLGLGILGVGTLLIIESTFAVGILGQSWGEYLSAYDITRGALFPIGLALMALAPLAVSIKPFRRP